MTILISADRFSTLPEGCPVRWGNDPAVVVAWHSATEYRVMVGPRRDFPAVAAESQLSVDLSTPAAVRAFAPELICAVRGLAHPLEYPPAALWAARAGHWVLVERVGLDGTLKVCRAATGVVTGPTPAACLLAGLQAALDAVGGAQ